MNCKCPRCSVHFTINDVGGGGISTLAVTEGQLIYATRDGKKPDPLGKLITCPACKSTFDIAEAYVPAPSSGACFIATACYGAYEHPSVQEFRWFRDARLNQYGWGRRFIDVYYRCSPQIATFLKKTPAIAAVVRRCVLAPILLVLRLVHDRNRT